MIKDAGFNTCIKTCQELPERSGNKGRVDYKIIILNKVRSWNTAWPGLMSEIPPWCVCVLTSQCLFCTSSLGFHASALPSAAPLHLYPCRVCLGTEYWMFFHRVPAGNCSWGPYYLGWAFPCSTVGWGSQREVQVTRDRSQTWGHTALC